MAEIADSDDDKGLESKLTGELFDELLIGLTHNAKLSEVLPVAAELRRRWALVEAINNNLSSHYSITWRAQRGKHVFEVYDGMNKVFVSKHPRLIEIFRRLVTEIKGWS